jgi:hypothetical protein
MLCKTLELNAEHGHEHRTFSMLDWKLLCDSSLQKVEEAILFEGNSVRKALLLVGPCHFYLFISFFSLFF